MTIPLCDQTAALRDAIDAGADQRVLEVLKEKALWSLSMWAQVAEDEDPETAPFWWDRYKELKAWERVTA